MPEFILQDAFTFDAGTTEWLDSLDMFTQSYVEAMFFTNQIELAEQAALTPACWPKSDDAPTYRIPAETREAIAADCQGFLTDCPGITDEPEWAKSQAGADFWFTRNGHGCGFWDGGWREPEATEYTNAAKVYGSCDLDLGDNGQLYVS